MQFGRCQKEKGLLLSHLPTLCPVVYRLAHSCCVTGKGCSGTQPLRKQSAAKQWQLFTSKPRLNTASIQAQQSKELTLHLSQSTSNTTTPQLILPLSSPRWPFVCQLLTARPSCPLPGDQGCPSALSPLPFPQLSSQPKEELPPNLALGFKIAPQIKNKQVL